MNLHIIFRSCSGSSVHFNERFIPVSKTTLISHCLKSLILSLHIAQKEQDTKPILTIVDDHSSEECVNEIKNLLEKCSFATEFIPLKGSGNNDSMKECYRIARDSSSDLLYLVEDDYLHSLNCLSEMILTYHYFFNKLSKNITDPEIAIMPVDNMFHYFDETMFSSPLVMGPLRHWRVNYYSNWSMLLSKKSIERHWEVWDKFSNYQLSKPETHEDSLLVPLFRSKIHLFTPVPTLALHVAGARYESPFSDWKKMWEEIEREWKILEKKTP